MDMFTTFKNKLVETVGSLGNHADASDPDLDRLGTKAKHLGDLISELRRHLHQYADSALAGGDAVSALAIDVAGFYKRSDSDRVAASDHFTDVQNRVAAAGTSAFRARFHSDVLVPLDEWHRRVGSVLGSISEAQRMFSSASQQRMQLAHMQATDRGTSPAAKVLQSQCDALDKKSKASISSLTVQVNELVSSRFDVFDGLLSKFLMAQSVYFAECAMALASHPSPRHTPRSSPPVEVLKTSKQRRMSEHHTTEDEEDFEEEYESFEEEITDDEADHPPRTRADSFDLMAQLTGTLNFDSKGMKGGDDIIDLLPGGSAEDATIDLFNSPPVSRPKKLSAKKLTKSASAAAGLNSGTKNVSKIQAPVNSAFKFGYNGKVLSGENKDSFINEVTEMKLGEFKNQEQLKVDLGDAKRDASLRFEANLDKWEFKNGVRKNLRTLLHTLPNVLWPNHGLQSLTLGDMTNESGLRKSYFKAVRIIHPDRVKKNDPEQLAIAERTFNAINQEWDKLQV